jgi:exopolysaccharide biosynthesis polyprenyl glycosylphosphotransferase
MQVAIEAPESLAANDRILRARRWFQYQHGLKRFLDIVIAALGLIGSLPLWVAIAIAIKLDSPGPVLHVQQRVGLNGRRFRFYKFRSMYADAEKRLESLLEHNEATGPVFKMRNDPRITRVGAILRRSSLDELPQLINILQGEMSLVGPRPPLPREVEQYRVSDRLRLAVKPGLTCLWQISGRSDCSFDQWMEMDVAYVRNLSLKLDLAILVRTFWAVLSCRGAY